MIVRKEQMEAFDREETKKFERRVLDRVRRHWPEHLEGLRNDEAAALIQAGIARAESYGFRLERDIATYINLDHLYWPGFDSQPHAARILKDPEMDASTKICFLLEDVPQPARRRCA